MTSEAGGMDRASYSCWCTHLLQKHMYRSWTYCPSQSHGGYVAVKVLSCCCEEHRTVHTLSAMSFTESGVSQVAVIVAYFRAGLEHYHCLQNTHLSLYINCWETAARSKKLIEICKLCYFQALLDECLIFSLRHSLFVMFDGHCFHWHSWNSSVDSSLL